MLTYHINPWKDPVLYAFIAGCLLTYAIIVLTMHCNNNWKEFLGMFMPAPLAHIAWIATFAAFAVSSILAYREMTYQGFVVGNDVAQEDSRRFIAIFIINIAVTALFAWVSFYLQYRMLGLIITVILMISLGYHIGLTSKWGKKNSHVNLRGATWLLLPYFILVGMLFLASYISLEMKTGRSQVS